MRRSATTFFGDDPTVNRLEETAAERMGKEGALFVASGTMGNLLGLLVSARPGQEVIADADSHVFLNEAAGAAMVGGIQIRQVRTERGVLSPAQVLAALRPTDDDHQPLSAAVMIENTHNAHGGVPWSLQELQRLSGTARSNGLAVHLDGARIFNAAIATGADVRAIAQYSDTVSLLPVQGAVLPGRQHIVRTSRDDQASQTLAEDAGRGYAASRSASRCGPGGPAGNGGPASR